MAAARAAHFARLLTVLSMVIREPGLGSIELAARAGVSERTLRRDLDSLRGLGYEVVFEDGYQLQESLDLERGTGPAGLAAVYQQQQRLVREQLGEPLAGQVVADVEALAPAALASLFAAALHRRLGFKQAKPPPDAPSGLNRGH